LSAEISGLEAESVSVNGVACVDTVRAKSSPSRIESAKFGPGIHAFPRREIVFPNIRGAAAKDQESTWVDDPYYASCYHKAGRAIARIAHFLLLKKEHSKRNVKKGNANRRHGGGGESERESASGQEGKSKPAPLKTARDAAPKWS
jgi:hypothetical protein